MIEVSHVSKHYNLGQTSVKALTDVTLTINKGDFAAIAGPSGSGKSTLLNLLGGIENPDSGFVAIDGVRISEMSPDQSADLRLKHVGFIFQTFNLLPVLTAYENIEYPLRLQHIAQPEKQKRVLALLEKVGMLPYADHKPAQLSGGQRQRVAIARALVANPSIILADEPTANLDIKTAEDILALMKRLHEEQGVSIIFSTHDPRIIRQADRLVSLENGTLVSISSLKKSSPHVL